MTLTWSSRFAKYRAWIDSPSFAEYVASRKCLRQVSHGRSATEISTEATVEALIPKGGRALYGLVGVKLLNRTAGELVVEACQSCEQIPFEHSLASQIDIVSIGLAEEYREPVFQELCQFVSERQDCPFGRLTVSAAAVGAVGSSALMMRALARTAVNLLWQPTLTNDDARKAVEVVMGQFWDAPLN